jgi:hypothetical protein
VLNFLNFKYVERELYLKIIFTLLIAFVMVSSFTVSAQAMLIDNLDGTITDTGFSPNGIEWIKDANPVATSTFGVLGINVDGTMTWEVANSMNTANYLGHSDWCLPTMVDDPVVWGYDGAIKMSWNIHLVL